MTKDEVTTLCFSALPYGDQICNLRTDVEPTAIRFNWRGGAYRVSNTLHVEEIENGCLKGSNEAMLIGTILKRWKGVRDLQSL